MTGSVGRSGVILILGIVVGSLLGTAKPSFGQNSTPIPLEDSGPALLGGDLPGDPQIQLVKVAEGFNDPVNVAFPNDGSGRIFVVERGGLVRIVESDGTLGREPFLDLTGEVTVRGSGEQGLLSLAFHPDYATNGRLYVNYNSFTANNAIIITEFLVSVDDPNRADPLSERPLLKIQRPFASHSGGTMRFDAGGFLLIGVGDGGESGDPYDNAQNRFSLLGKMLRIDVDGGGPGRTYGIPPDNPFIGPDRADNPFPGSLPSEIDAARDDNQGRRSIGHVAVGGRESRSQVPPEIWALGFRQPWSFAIDQVTGDIYIADVGALTVEEINFWKAGTPAGQNYGWDWLEGSHCYPEELTECPRQQVGVLPVAEYLHGDDGCAVIALGVYRGDDAPDLDGLFLSADYCTGKIRGLVQQATGRWIFQDLLDTALLITSGNQDETGAIYVTGRTYAGPPEKDGNKPLRSKKQRDTLWRIFPADQVPAGAETVPLGDVDSEAIPVVNDQGTEERRANAEPQSSSSMADERVGLDVSASAPQSPRDKAGRSGAVTVDMYDFAYNPSRVVIDANVETTLFLRNSSATVHNFSIDRLNLNMDLASGDSQYLEINMPAGSYPIYCAIPGHKEAGMTGVLVVRTER